MTAGGKRGDSLSFLSAPPPAGRRAKLPGRPLRAGRSPRNPLKKALPRARPPPARGRNCRGRAPRPPQDQPGHPAGPGAPAAECRRLRILVGLTLALTLALAWALGALAPSLGALSDLADTVRIGLTPGEGFPVKTNISPILQLEELSGGFVELGEQDLVLYSASGAGCGASSTTIPARPSPPAVPAFASMPVRAMSCGWKAAARLCTPR